MMTATDKVDVAIGVNGQKIRVSMLFSQYLAFAQVVETGVPAWQTFKQDQDGEVRVNTAKVDYVRLISLSKALRSGKFGVTMYDLALVMNEKYHTLRQRIKKQGIKLEKSSDRRILLSDNNFYTLKLDDKQVKRLKDLEKKMN